MNKGSNSVFWILFLTITLILQPLVSVGLQVAGPIVPVAQAAIDKPEGDDSSSDEADPADLDVGDAKPTMAANFVPTDLNDLETLDNIQGNLKISPTDIDELKKEKVDVRVTDYLMDLVLPVDEGGQGLGHVKVNRIFKNYTSQGVGKYDREGVNATVDEDVVSGHNRGQAVDISEVGEVTCKLVEKHHVGADTTHFQKPLPVKVAWQSVNGAKNNPTPTAQSILGAAGDSSAQSILAYLNSSGEMDYYADYVKGLDLKTIVSYVGANVLQKSFGINQVSTDPFAGGLLQALGGAAISATLPGLPPGIASGNGTDDARLAVAKARLEQGLNLPPGSLRGGNGWDNILQTTGKRSLETSLGLPQGYFDKHNLDDASKLEVVKNTLSHFVRGDDSLNLMTGTIEAFNKKDPNAFKMAGVTILGSALHLPTDQKQILAAAVQGKISPSINLLGVPVGEVISPADLGNLFSSDAKEQKAAEQSLKQIGLQLLQQAAGKIVKNKYAGLTASLLATLLDPNKTITLSDLTAGVAASTIGIQVGLSDSGLDRGKVNSQKLIKDQAAAIAKSLNNDLNLTIPASQVTADDIFSLVDPQGNDFNLADKLGMAEVDKAFGWNPGSTGKVVNNQKSLADASQEIFFNFVDQSLGLEPGSVATTGDIPANYGYADLANRLNLDPTKLRAAPTFAELEASDPNKKLIRDAFNIDSSEPLATLQANNGFWDDPANTSGWSAIDTALGAPTGSVRSYLKGQSSTPSLAHQSGQGSLAILTPERIYDFFDISDQNRLDTATVQTVIKLFTGQNLTGGDITAGAQTILRLVGRSVDQKSNFALDTFAAFITAPNSKTATDLLLDQGIHLVAQSLGLNNSALNFDYLQIAANAIISIFNGSVMPSSADPAAGLGPLFTPYRAASDFVMRATGIPFDFRQDGDAILRGDWRTGIAAASFANLLPQINAFMPRDNQFNYAEMRQAFNIDNPGLIDAKVRQIAADGSLDLTALNAQNTDDLRQVARRQLMEEAQKNIEYRTSDSLLRKLDPAIPVGFSRVLYSGTAAERGDLLQGFVFGKLDVAISKLTPLYLPGTLQALYQGKISASDVDKIVLNFINRSDLNIGPFTNAFVTSFYEFIRVKDRTDFFTSSKYQSMWGYFDSWLTDELSIGGLPSGLTKSLYFASQNGWNLDANLKNGVNIIVPSVNALAKDFLVGKISGWGDKQLGLPTGSVFKIYQLTTAFIRADQLLGVAHASGSATAITAAQGAENAARAQLILFAVGLALGACSVCQKFFGSVDQAINAPPGFTQSLLLGTIGMFLGLGLSGFYIAAAVYLFGAYKTVYLCPTPPQDVWAIPEYDGAQDQTDFGLPYDQLPDNYNLITSSPAPGQNPFEWQHQAVGPDGAATDVTFSDGNNARVWLGWARYYTGRLIQSTLDYGDGNEAPNKPLQLLTYRQANVEFFTPESVEAFGEGNFGNPNLGLGFTQATTKTTDWVHVGFGGLY